ncbi:gene transfer agent family protein [Alsobacter soli]|uniref:Gene transfer agent family protein n=1 Tax=Alsobacter soli TaxID=2109933 RepID=A0A2T1HSA4_9HYPH|nr:gene transfer agent family protein [Alsobacter soli]PSC04522.1 gene transfer agent family protein [Alsobacter soli]
MPNLRRGDAELVLGGRRFTLRLTLGALAELEAAFAAESLDDLGRRFASGALSARDLVRLLGAGIRGGGADLSDEEVAALPLGEGLEAVADAIARMLLQAFGSGGDRSPRP